jgi:hypothetical protein
VAKRAGAWAEVAMAAALGAYFVYQLAAASRYPPEPALFPRIVALAGIGLAAAVALRVLRLPPAAPADAIAPAKLAVVVSAPIVFGLGLWLFGYWLASAAALIVLPLLLGLRQWKALVLTSLAVTLFFGLVLGYLDVRLPRGLLFHALTGE